MITPNFSNLLQLIPERFREQGVKWWQGRDTREQWVLIVGSLIAVTIIGVSLLTTLVSSYQNLKKTLPELQLQAAKSDYLAQTWLEKEPKQKEPLQKSLQRAHAIFVGEGFLSLPSTPEGMEGKVSINIQEASLESVLRWAQMIEVTLGLSIKSVNLLENPESKKLSGHVVVTQ